MNGPELQQTLKDLRQIFKGIPRGLNFDLGSTDATLITGIVDSLNVKKDFIFGWFCLNIATCHLNGCPLDLDGLLTASPSDRNHDVMGISQHLDHPTGKLKNGFVPRFAAKVGCE
jgi:hypothetical protein